MPDSQYFVVRCCEYSLLYIYESISGFWNAGTASISTGSISGIYTASTRFEVLYWGYCLYSKHFAVRYCGYFLYSGFCHTPSTRSMWAFSSAHTPYSQYLDGSSPSSQEYSKCTRYSQNSGRWNIYWEHLRARFIKNHRFKVCRRVPVSYTHLTLPTILLV